MKFKEKEFVVAGIKLIEKESGRSPNRLWTDDGAELENNDVKREWNWYTTSSKVKVSIVER